MAWHVEKETGDIVIDGFQEGISGSPHGGIADMKCLNINSFPGEASVNYARIAAIPVVSADTMHSSGGNNELDYTPSGGNQALVKGSVVIPSASTITNFIVNTKYWVTSVVASGRYQFSLSYNGPTITNFGLTGTATFSTKSFAKFIQGTDEYIQSSGVYRYYLVDTNAQVWVNDPAVYGVFSPAGSPGVITTNCQGMSVSQGVITLFIENQAVQRFTNRIGDDSLGGTPWNAYNATNPYLNTPAGSIASHRAIRSQVANGAVFFPDSQFIGNIQGANSQFSLMRCTTPGSSSTITIVELEQGVFPINYLSVSVYAPQGGSVPSGISEGTQYYIVASTSSNSTFGLSATVGGSAIVIGAGSFYTTTFVPSLGTTFIFNRQALALPYYEQATALAEVSVGSTVNLVIGGISQYIEFWDESSSGYTTVKLPEGASGTSAILNVNNSAFVFAGNKGTIYITNATGMAGTLTVPDYCANPNGGNQDPYFIWGTQPTLIRGRVFFGIQDQNSLNTTGNCGGIWSFTPPQNGAIETNTQGLGLHLEGQNSYGTYNGICNVILASQNQQANGPQYWSAWTSNITNPTYGIDFSSTSPYTGGQARIDTDLVNTGSDLTKNTFSNIEYKLSRPLVSGESIEILQRPTLTSSFSDIGTGPGGPGIDNTVGNISYAFPVNFQFDQWAQFRAILTATATNPSFLGLTQLRLRK